MTDTEISAADPAMPDRNEGPDIPDGIELLASLSPDFVADPYTAFRRLRERGPVHQVITPDRGLVWLVVGYEAAREAFGSPHLSRDWQRDYRQPGWEPPYALNMLGNSNMLMSDPPHHTRLRKLVSQEFTARRVEGMRQRVQEITDELLDDMTADAARSAEIIEAFASPLPMIVIAELLGVPHLDRASFHAWSNETLAPTSPEAEKEAYEQIMPYLAGLIAAKRENPGEDLLSALVHTVDEGGDRLTEQELVSLAFLLLVAGHETTVNTIGNAVRALFDHPDQLAAVRADPAGLAAGLVEETLRYDGPVATTTPRIALEDTEIGGVQVPRGAIVLIAMAGADHDPERFPDPERFDVRRSDARSNLSFGHGIHFCLGAPLARLEGEVALRTLLERCPDLAPDGEPGEWLPGLLIRGRRELPVRW
ncbi:cytochrome P450 [Streptomyces sp. PvR006]|uniref:cytochrome P450 family protein n=1 Tax=unclassified Streptomyces TaxID=2593676 RepID=UPI0027DB70BB|nr:cytochrome P450 [Streptomyces sp. PvR006]MBP2585314.1 cytochrome P450 [Streptomyces sp. PvR006]